MELELQLRATIPTKEIGRVIQREQAWAAKYVLDLMANGLRDNAEEDSNKVFGLSRQWAQARQRTGFRARNAKLTIGRSMHSEVHVLGQNKWTQRQDEDRRKSASGVTPIYDQTGGKINKKTNQKRYVGMQRQTYKLGKNLETAIQKYGKSLFVKKGDDGSKLFFRRDKDNRLFLMFVKSAGGKFRNKEARTDLKARFKQQTLGTERLYEKRLRDNFRKTISKRMQTINA